MLLCSDETCVHASISLPQILVLVCGSSRYIRQKEQHDRHSHWRVLYWPARMVPEFPCGSLLGKGRNFQPSRTCHLPGSTREWELQAKTHDHLRVGMEHPPAEDFQEEIADPLPDVDVNPSRSNTENSLALTDQHVPPHTFETTHEETTSTPTEGTTRRYPSQTQQPPDRLYGTMN